MSVELFLEVAQANDAARRFLLTVKGADAAVEELGQDLDATGRDLKQVAANTDVAARAVDDLGDEARSAAVGLRVLDHELDKVRRSTLGLAAVRAGSGFWGALIPGNWGGKGDFDFSNFASEFRGFGMTALIGGIAALSPMLAGAVGTAVVGAVGLGGVVGGVAAAAMDPRVQQHWGTFVSRLKDDLVPLSDAFALPVIAGMDIVEGRLGAPGGLISILQGGTQWVEPIAESLMDLVDNLGPGIAAALDSDLMNQIAESLPKIGDAVSTLLRTFDTHGEAIGEGFDDTIDTLNATLIIIGGVLVALSELWQEIRRLGSASEDLWNKIPPWARGPGAIGGAAEWLLGKVGMDVERNRQTLSGESNVIVHFRQRGAVEAAKAANELADAIKKVNEQIGELIGQHLSWERLQIALRQGMADLRRQLAGGGGIGLDSQRGRDNRDMILDQIELLEKAREEAIKRGNNTEEAARKADLAYLREIARLMELARQAGATRAQIEALFAPVYMPIVIDLIMPGIRVVGNMIKDIFGGFFAEGGRPTPGVPAIVGEKGPEIFVPDSAGTIYPNSAVRWSGYTAGPAQSAAPAPVNITVQLLDSDGNVTRRALIRDANTRGVAPATIRSAYP